MSHACLVGSPTWADLEDVAVGTEEVKDRVTVVLARGETVDHNDRPTPRHGRGAHHAGIRTILGTTCQTK